MAYSILEGYDFITIDILTATDEVQITLAPLSLRDESYIGNYIATLYIELTDFPSIIAAYSFDITILPALSPEEETSE